MTFLSLDLSNEEIEVLGKIKESRNARMPLTVSLGRKKLVVSYFDISRAFHTKVLIKDLGDRDGDAIKTAVSDYLYS